MQEYTDLEIIEGLKNTQNDVILYVYDKYLPMVNHLICRMGGTTDDARDIFQDALLIILTKIAKNTLVLNCMFKTFLYCICQNRWKDVLDKRCAATNYLVRNVDIPEDRDFTEYYDEIIYNSMYTKMFEKLNIDCKKIIEFVLRDISPKEIALNFGFTYNYFKKKKCICQKDFIKEINKNPFLKSMIQSRRELIIPEEGQIQKERLFPGTSDPNSSKG